MALVAFSNCEAHIILRRQRCDYFSYLAHVLILYSTLLNSLQMLQHCHLLKMNVMVHPDHHRLGNQKLYSAILYKHLCTISIPLLKRWSKSFNLLQGSDSRFNVR